MEKAVLTEERLAMMEKWRPLALLLQRYYIDHHSSTSILQLNYKVHFHLASGCHL